MAVVATNVIQGPADIYVAAFPAAEPPATLAGLAAPPPAPWRHTGATDDDGVTITVTQNFEMMTVGQVIDNVGARQTERAIEVEVNIAEPTLENLKLALNGGLVTAATAADAARYTPRSSDASVLPDYIALCIDGPGVGGGRARLIVRRALSTDDVEFAYSKGEMTVYSMTFTGFYVSSTVLPFELLSTQ